MDEEERLMPHVFHIRRPLPPRGGNQWYRNKDPDVRKAFTYCGTEPGLSDVPSSGSIKPWIGSDGIINEPCAACVDRRRNESKQKRMS